MSAPGKPSERLSRRNAVGARAVGRQAHVSPWHDSHSAPRGRHRKDCVSHEFPVCGIFHYTFTTVCRAFLNTHLSHVPTATSTFAETSWT